MAILSVIIGSECRANCPEEHVCAVWSCQNRIEYNMERVNKQKSRWRQPDTFMLFDSREVPQNDDHKLRNPIAIE